jgi:hypothetical protein
VIEAATIVGLIHTAAGAPESHHLYCPVAEKFM